MQDVTPTSPPTTPRTTTKPPTDQRVGLVRGDRLCQQCAYNLTGQPVVREHHYNMLIVRCPECGSVASVQQHPVLSQWIGRLHGLWLAAWILFLLAIGLGGTVVIAGFGFGTATRASFDAQEALSNHYMASLGPDAVQDPNQMQLYNNADFDQWWKQQDVGALRAKLGGVWSLVDRSIYLPMLVPLTLMAAILGVFWSAFLIQWSRKRLLVWWFVLIAFLLIWSSIFAQTITPGLYATVSIWTACHELVGVPILWTTSSFGAVVLLVSLLFGRSILRAFVRHLLPPRMQASLGTLWRTDGLEPPPLPDSISSQRRG